jgi:hypothetical protein
MFASVKPSAATVHRTVAFNLSNPSLFISANKKTHPLDGFFIGGVRGI